VDVTRLRFGAEFRVSFAFGGYTPYVFFGAWKLLETWELRSYRKRECARRLFGVRCAGWVFETVGIECES